MGQELPGGAAAFLHRADQGADLLPRLFRGALAHRDLCPRADHGQGRSDVMRGLGDEGFGARQPGTKPGNESVQRGNERPQLHRRRVIDKAQVLRPAPLNRLGQTVDRAQRAFRGQNRQKCCQREKAKAKRRRALGDALGDRLFPLPGLRDKDRHRDRLARHQNGAGYGGDPHLCPAIAAGVKDRPQRNVGNLGQGQVVIAGQGRRPRVDPVEHPVGADRPEDRKRLIGQIDADPVIAALKPFGDCQRRGPKDAVLRRLGRLVGHGSDGQVEDDRQKRRDGEKLENQPKLEGDRGPLHSIVSR